MTEINIFRYYNWQIAGPIVMSVVVFQRPIPDVSVVLVRTECFVITKNNGDRIEYYQRMYL